MSRKQKLSKELNGEIVHIGNRNLERTVRNIKRCKTSRTLIGVVKFGGKDFPVKQVRKEWYEIKGMQPCQLQSLLKGRNTN
jgi:hypothetical protein